MKAYIIDLQKRFPTKLLSLILFYLLISCNSFDYEFHLEELHQLNSSIDKKGWEMVKRYKFKDENAYILSKKISDTTYLLSFSYFKISKYKKDTSFYFIDYYKKNYNDSNFFHELCIQNRDTLYFFKYPLKFYPTNSFDKMIFISGKYFYMNKYGKLNSQQREYFDIHKDSLIKIKGNDLPQLPSNSCQIDTLKIPEEVSSEIF